MKLKLLLLVVAIAPVLSLIGCSNEPAPASPEEKKLFMGSAMPKGFNPMKSGSAPGGGAPADAEAAAKAAAAKAAAAHGG